jgi:Mg2+ and Co2+ transporter CorA
MPAPWERPEEAEQPKESTLAPWEKPKAEAGAPWDKPQADELGRFVANKEPEPTKDTGITDMISRAVSRGVLQTGSALGDVLPAIAASTVGADEYARKQMEEAAATQREIEQKYGARYKQLSDVKGVGDYIPFALETIAEQAPNLLTAFVPGIGGGVAGARMGAATAAKALAEREATQAGAKYAAMKTAQGAMLGQGVGTYLGSYALNTPEIFQNIYEETGGQLEPGAALIAGSVSAALDSVLPATLLRRLTPGAKAGVVEKLLEKSGMQSDIARKAVGMTITGALEEAPTEAAQEAISIFAEKFVQDHPEAWGSKEFNRIVESGVRGAVGGGGFGGITGLGSAALERHAAGREERQLDRDRAEIFSQDFEEKTGRKPTQEEVATFVAAARKATKETESEDTGADTGAGEPGISVPGEERTTTAGLDTTDTGGVERTESTTGGTEAGEGAKPSALDQKSYDELLEIKNNYQIELNGLLYKNGNKPREGTKRREEYDGLHTRLIDINNRLDEKYKAEQTQKTAAPTTLESYFETKDALVKRLNELGDELDNLRSKPDELRDKGINEGDAHKYWDEIQDTKKRIEDGNKEFQSIFQQIEALEVPSEETTTAETPAAETKPGALTPWLTGYPKDEQRYGTYKSHPLVQKAEEYLQKLSDKLGEFGVSFTDIDRTSPKELQNIKDKMSQIAGSTTLTMKKLEAIDKKYKRANPAQQKEIADLLTKDFEEADALLGAPKVEAAPAKTEGKKRKSKADIDEMLDNLDDHPERLSIDDLDNLFADPVVTKQENTSPKADQVPLTDPLFSTAHPSVTRAINQNDIQGVLQALKTTGGKFISALAERLSELGLTTTIGWDGLHYDLAMKSLDGVKGQKDRITKWIQQIYPEVYRNRFDESKMRMPVTETLQAFKDLRDGKLGIPPGMFKEDLADVIKVYEKTVKTLNSPGTFFTRFNAIGLSLMGGGNSNYVVTHELTHAATHWAIDNPGKLNKEQQIALGKLEALYEFAKKRTTNPSAYGYNNLHEFVAEAFSRPEFQKELRAMKASMETNQSAWSKFIQLVAKLIGIDNVLFHTLSNADILFSARANSEVTNGADLLWSPSRYDVRDGKFTLNPGERMSWLNRLIKLKEKWQDVDKGNVKQFFASLNNQYRKYLLGALSVDQLADIYGDNMPQLKLYVKEVDAMIATRNAILKEGDPIITKWSILINVNPEKSKQLGKTMIEATLKKIDPDPKSIGYDPKVMLKEPELKKAWQELASGKDGNVAVEIYRQVREFYERRMNEYVQVQLQRIEESGKVKGLSDEEIEKKKLDFKKATEEKIIRPYFPIKRFGEYFLMVGQGQKKIFMQFEDAFARDAELERQKAKLMKTMTEAEANRELWPGQGFNEVLNQKLNDISQLNKIYEMIDETADGVMTSAATDPAVAANQVAAFQKELKDEFGQYYLEMLPSESIKKMFLHRENVAGPSQDMLRAFGLSRERIAYQRARFQHMPALFNIIEASKLRLKSMPTPEEKAVYGDVSNELAKQFKDGVLEPPKQNKLTTYLTHFGFLNFLTSPASAVVNMMAVPGLYIPVAGARYGGVKKVGRIVTKYTRMLGGTGYVNADTGRYEFLSLARANLQDQTSFVTKDGKTISLPKGMSLAEVYAAGVNRNVIDTTMVHDAVDIGEHPSADYTGRWQKFMYYASLPFHAAEKFNREVSYMTSFELAYEKAINKGMSKEKAFETAIDEARDLTQETMFNYNTTNKPRYFRGNLASILLQFKMYPQNLSMLMFRTFYKAINQNEAVELEMIRQDLATAPKEVLEEALAAKRAELAEMKKQSRDAFLGMMGMSFLTAGLTGMPLWFIFSGLASAFNTVFGDDDEFDPENWFKNWANRTFGGFVGDTISRGLLSQATGLNFADRMNTNLPDLWFPDVRKGTDETDYAKNMFINLMGPSAGALLVNYPEALKRYNDGYTERAMEAMMPAAIKNVLVGVRYMAEGQAESIKGNLIQDVNAGEALAQMLGFSPESVAQAQKAAIEMKNVNESILRKHTDLLNAFFIALDGGDDAMLDKVLDKIAKYNASVPELPIDGEALLKSVNKRYKDRALADITGGMGINKKLLPRLEGMLDYSKD